MRLLTKALLIAAIICAQHLVIAQNDKGRLTGDFYATSQYYQANEALGATLLPGGERVGVNTALNLNYDWKNLTAGLRYEAYLPPLLGFERRLDGHGIGNVFLSYRLKSFELTVGNFYEQFGSGLSLRSYYEPQLGLDNSLFGARLKYYSDAVNLTLLTGKNRSYFDKDDSNILALNADVSINSLFKNINENLIVDIGASIVRKTEDNTTGIPDISESSDIISLRGDVQLSGFLFGLEYARKGEEPHTLNQFTDKNGRGFFLSTGYSTKGFGVNVYWKFIENMFFRSDRESSSNITSGINYLPPNSNINTYRLTTLYPYATQGNGENGVNVDVFYNIKKGTALGGKYGTKLASDFSIIKGLKTDGPPEDPARFLSFSDSTYYANWNLEITKRVNKKLRYVAGWSYIKYNRDVIEGIPRSGFVNSLTFFTDITFRLPKRRFIRTELQHLSTKQHLGNWAFGLVEYGWSSNLSTYISDEWNYDSSVHYYSLGLNYRKGPTSVGISYVRERSGLICVGGVCRFVPASNGFRLQVNTSF